MSFSNKDKSAQYEVSLSIWIAWYTVLDLEENALFYNERLHCLLCSRCQWSTSLWQPRKIQLCLLFPILLQFLGKVNVILLDLSAQITVITSVNVVKLISLAKVVKIQLHRLKQPRNVHKIIRTYTVVVTNLLILATLYLSVVCSPVLQSYLSHVSQVYIWNLIS